MEISKISKNSKIELFKIKAEKYELYLSNVGASIFDLKTYDKNNQLESIVLKVNNPEELLINEGFFGACVGRNAGRIKDGIFELNNKKYQLTKNSLGNNLHSGDKGLCKRITMSNVFENSIEFSITLFSKDDGFPGNINIKIVYLFSEDEFKIKYSATSSEDTICNITNHTYFNLSGNLKRDIKKQNLNFKNLKSYWELDDTNVPLEKIECPKSTIEEFIKKYKNSPQAGMDHPFEIKNNFLELKDDISGRKLHVSSSYNYAVLYTQNWKVKDLGEKINQGIAIEFQHLPNDINISGRESKTILRKNDMYNEWVKYSFN